MKVIYTSDEKRRIAEAERLAHKWHVGQTYVDDRPYAVTHLKNCVKVGADFGLTSVDQIVALWLHDGPEDAKTKEEREERLRVIRETFGENAYQLVWAVTGVGEKRAIRNADIMTKVLAFPDAAPVKAIDRLINIIASAHEGSTGGLIKMYAKEHDAFIYVRPYIPERLWTMIEQAFPAGMVKKRGIPSLLLTYQANELFED